MSLDREAQPPSGASLERRDLLLTGAGGFLGRYVAQAASEGGWLVHGVDLADRANAADMASYRQLRLPDPQLFEEVKKIQPRLCVHCAGNASVAQSISEPLADFEAGPGVTVQLLEALRRYAPECRVIFLSSAAVYGNPSALPVNEAEPARPISPYGFHKWQCEILCREYAEVFGLRTASVRIFSAYGPGLRRQVLWDVCRKALAYERPFTLHGTGNESRDFIHGVDIAEALMLVARSGTFSGEIYNVASGEETSIRQIAEHVTSALKVKDTPMFDGSATVGNPTNWRADITKVRQLGFSPRVYIQAGIESYARWARAELLNI
ncbi:MAG: NAD-dependent epimerase/dehydratase family protein [Bryobacteraceae bacterium]